MSSLGVQYYEGKSAKLAKKPANILYKGLPKIFIACMSGQVLAISQLIVAMPISTLLHLLHSEGTSP